MWVGVPTETAGGEAATSLGLIWRMQPPIHETFEEVGDFILRHDWPTIRCRLSPQILAIPHGFYQVTLWISSEQPFPHHLLLFIKKDVMDGSIQRLKVLIVFDVHLGDVDRDQAYVDFFDFFEYDTSLLRGATRPFLVDREGYNASRNLWCEFMRGGSRPKCAKKACLSNPAEPVYKDNVFHWISVLSVSPTLGS